MERVRLDKLSPRGWAGTAVTVGNFDGVHRGHQALVREAVSGARAASGTAVALTFDPHPSRVLSPERALASLMTLDQKAEVLAGLGVDRLAVLPFTREVAEKTPEAFAREVLAVALGARLVVVGSNFRFGRAREGDVGQLEALGRALGFAVRAVEPVWHAGGPISSSRVREALARGAVASARELLGRSFFVDGLVMRGDGRGRGMGIPTANLEVVNETLPRAGVYACRVRLPDGAELAAVANLGRRPTFGGEATTLEAHLLDFEGDLYGADLRVAFVERLRDERRFPGPDALVAQIRADVAEARRVLNQAGGR
jgi:riboflavin kinase/FMN adenylyltransferase